MPVDHLGLWYPPTTVHPSQLHTPHPPGYTYSDPIPAFTALTPGELLDAYYSDRRNDPDWTDPNGVLSKQLEACLNHPHYAVAPIGSAGLISEWPRPNDLAAEPVPVCWEMVQPEVEIEFRNLDPECPSAGMVPVAGSRCQRELIRTFSFASGIPLNDFNTPNPKVLAGADDLVLYGSKGMELKFVIAVSQREAWTLASMLTDACVSPVARIQVPRVHAQH